MAPRASMAHIIAQVRLMISDPSGASTHYTDEQVQGALDDNCEVADSAPLSVRLGGTLWLAAVGWWEEGAVVHGAAAEALEPDGADLRRGEWAFDTAQADGLTVTGRNYDVYGAAADLLDIWAAAYAQEIASWSADGMSVKRATGPSMRALAASYRAKARGVGDATGFTVAQMVRTDTW